MSVQSEINRINTAKNNIATAITNKGKSVPSGTKLDGMAALIDGIESGGNELIVTAPTGSTVTATKDGVTKTATEKNGTWTFKGLEAGNWTITAKKGSDTATQVVTVSAETTVLAYLPKASTTPTSGVSYTNGLSGLDAATVSLISHAISNNSAITNATSTVYIDYGTMHRKISVGDKVSLSLNGTSYTFDIIGFNHDTLTTPTAYGSTTATGKAGITLHMHNLLYGPSGYWMNGSNTNSGGWKNSLMRNTNMVTMKSYLPDEWEAIIVPVNKAAGKGGGSSSGVETVSDSCFLLAEIEIFGKTTYSVSGEGTQYAYYKAGNTPKKVVLNGGATYWWERSPRSGNTQAFGGVSDQGLAGQINAYSAYCIAFAFCV